MFSKFLCTDVLAIRCVDNLIFVGMGCVLYIFNGNTYKLEEKINSLYPYNIHGIIEGPDNKLTVFGENLFCTYKIYLKQETLTIEEDSCKKRLNDWIVSAKWVAFNGYNYLCVLLAHNNVCIYDIFSECYRSIWCEEKCILYAGSIFDNSNEDVIIFSGTVYQEILIWQINYAHRDNTSPVLHCLQGHNGVIFSVVYDPLAKLICSTSDDRTVRLWKISNNKSENNDHLLEGKLEKINWRKVNIRLMRTMFGHTARVWKSVIRNEILITIGEDSLMCTWSLDGKLLNKVYAHHGAAIWSIDISDDNKIIFTGGADGAIHAWPFVNDYIQKAILLPKAHIHTLPKYVYCLRSGNFLIFNENGTLFTFDNCYRSLGSLYLEKYSTYCVMEVSLCRSCVCFASRDGYITIYKEVAPNKELQQIIEEKIMDSQIFSVQWLENNKLVICGINGILKIIGIAEEGLITVESVCLLPYSRERWLTAAVLYEGLLVCGDRAGNMHVFDLEKPVSYNGANISETNNKCIQTFVKVHGKIGIQSFIVFNSKLISAGRDGMLKFYELNKHEKQKLLCTLHKQKMPMDWISGYLKSSDDIFILGFKEVEFIIYSMFHYRILMRIPCGGGHRSWDCMLQNEFIVFLYIRNKQVYVSDFPLSSFTSPVLLNGFHTKEIYCINPILKIGQNNNIFISGGEDSTVRISCISSTTMNSNFFFRTLNIFDGHISSIKFITYLSLQTDHSYNKYLIFSGGGRAQIKVWEIDIKDSEICLQNTDVSCHDITSHMLYGFGRPRKKQWQESNHFYNMEPESRYMDIEVYRCPTNLHCILLFVACADGFVRLFLYDINTRNISLKAHVKCVDRCITKITVLTYNEKVIVLTMSTDGIGRFIDFTDIISKIIIFPQNEEQEYHNCKNLFIISFNLHQSGINSYDIKMIEKNEYLLATGGDDNLFNIICFKVQFQSTKKELHISLLSKWNSSTAHAAQITGIIFREKNIIFSVGVDQRVNMYCYDYTNSILSVTFLKKISTFVTDVKGLTSWYNSKGESVVCVYGRGFEILLS